MKNTETNWTKEEFIAYLLLYAAQANYIDTEEEKEIISKKISYDFYKKIHKELEKDNDFQSLEKILANVKKFDYTSKNIDLLLKEIEILYLSDGICDPTEKSMFMGLKRLLKIKE